MQKDVKLKVKYFESSLDGEDIKVFLKILCLNIDLFNNY